MIQDNGDGTLTYKGLPKAALDAIDALRNPYGVPTGVVPRVDPRAELERQLLQPDPPPGPMKGIAHFTPLDPIAQAVDDYLLMERKARAWEKLAVWAHMNDRELFDRMDDLVHPAQEPSTR